jgi:uncharacterized protein YutE (UPF0331/DUF86 family)
MRLDLYQAETARIAAEQAALLAQAREILSQGRALNALEQSGVLHALQVLIENAIGKAKQLLNARKEPVPVSAHDTFASLACCGEIEQTALPAWNAVVGLRNRIVRAYTDVDMNKVLELINTGSEKFIVVFLLKPV